MRRRRHGRGGAVRGSALTARITIRPARRAEIPALRAIEIAAAARFRAIGMDGLADLDEAGAIPDDFAERCIAQGTLWAAELDGGLCGFLAAFPADGALHIGELDVLPGAAGQRIGAALIDAAEACAAARAIAWLSLVTFRDVAWNAPYYGRLGFRAWPPQDWGPRHHRTWAAQKAEGLDMTRRLIMRRAVTPDPHGEDPALVRRLWTAMAARDWDAARACLDARFHALWPHTGELIESADAYVGLNRAYPGDWSVRLDGLTRLSDGRVQALVHVTNGEAVSRCVALCDLWDGRIAAATEYWLDESDPPFDRTAFARRLRS